MAFRLPPLNTLRLFEAAGRHSSFRRAAEELELTPSAVSHGVQTIEGWLGVRLFVRSSRGLQLTKAGHAYLPAVQECLTILSTATDRIPGRRQRDQLVVSVAPTFAVRILLPRLAGFRRAYPKIAITIDTSHRQVDFPQDGIDLAIRVGQGRWPGLDAFELLREQLVPVCSPDVLARLASPPDYNRTTLIHVTSASQGWPEWAAAAGHRLLDHNRGLYVDTLQMAFEAAERGLGAAIGHLPLILPELNEGRLALASETIVESSTPYWLVGLRETMQQPEILAFHEWLRRELADVGSTPRAVSASVSAVGSGVQDKC